MTLWPSEARQVACRNNYGVPPGHPWWTDRDESHSGVVTERQHQALMDPGDRQGAFLRFALGPESE